jgi:sulfate permease, SulP family
VKASFSFKDVTAGTIGAIVVFPTILNCGSVVSQPLGAGYAVIGIAAAFCASIVVSLLRGVFAGEPLHLVSPKANYAAMVSSVLVGALAVPAFAQSFPDPDRQAAMLMALSFLCAIIAGALQAVLGLTRLGTFVKFIPYPVVAGFINGFAIHLLLAQIPPMLGERTWSALWGAARDSGILHPGAGLVGVLACAITVLVPRFVKRGSPALWGLGFGTALYWGATAAAPNIGWGGIIGAIPATLPIHPQFAELTTLVTSPVFASIGPDLVATAVMLAMIASLQSLLSISSADAALGTRHDSNRELVLQGSGNMLAGLLGGMATGGSPSVTRTVIEDGGRGRTANLAHGVALAVLAIGLGDAIGLIPTAVMAGVVVASTFNQMDDWSRRLLQQVLGQRHSDSNGDLLGNLGIVMTVTALVIVFGVLPALVGGMSLAFAVFVRQASHNIVRRTVIGTHLHSRTSRPAAVQAALSNLVHGMILVEVQGPIFFGSADHLTTRLEDQTKALRIVILDFKRVTDIDGSGVVALERLDKALARQKCQLLLSYLPQGGTLRHSLKDMGFARIFKDRRVFEDNDGALAHAEDLLLRESGFIHDDLAEYALRDFDIFKGMKPEDAALIGHDMVRSQFDAGTAIVREGDNGDSFYLLAAGRVTVSRHVAGRVLRFSGCSPGISFGEIGMLTAHPRSADVIADTSVVCWSMDGNRFRALCADRPDLGRLILTNIAIGLSDLVASLSNMVRELER